MPDGNTNQRVTNAILQKDIDSLAEKIEALSGTVEGWRKEDRAERDKTSKEGRAERDKTSKRLVMAEGHVVRCATLWDSHKAAHQTIDADIKSVEGDVKRWSLFGGGSGGILAVIFSMVFDR